MARPQRISAVLESSPDELQQAANQGPICIINARRVIGHRHIYAIVPETGSHQAEWDNAHQQLVRPLTSQPRLAVTTLNTNLLFGGLMEPTEV